MSRCGTMQGFVLHERRGGNRAPTGQGPSALRRGIWLPGRVQRVVKQHIVHARRHGAPLPNFNPILVELHERFAGDYLRHYDSAITITRRPVTGRGKVIIRLTGEWRTQHT